MEECESSMHILSNFCENTFLMMKNTWLFFPLLVVSFLFTGCFEILEEVDLKSDGSGTLRLTINMSESKSNLSNFLDAGEVQGVKLPSRNEIERNLTRAKSALMESPGISNVSISTDFEEFIFVVNAAFEEVEDLNQAINHVADALNRTPFETIKLDNFDLTDQSFRRYFNYPVGLVDYESLPSMHRYVLETARLVNIYRFDRQVRMCTNDKAQISPSRQAVKMECSVGEVLNGSTTIANSVIF